MERQTSSRNGMSLRGKIGLLSIACIVLISASLIFLNIIQSHRSAERVQNRTGDMLTDAVKQRLGDIAQSESLKISGFLETSLASANTLALTQESDIKTRAGMLLSGQEREVTITTLSGMLKKDKTLLGTYVAYEPQMFDQSDELYANKSAMGSDANGRFIPYISRSSSGGFANDLLVGMEDQSRDANGIRAGEYYLCPKDSSTSCVTDPYIYKVDGKDTLLVSVTSPIKYLGSFVGIAGVDVALEFVQQSLVDANGHLYNGSGNISVISPAGIVAGSTSNGASLGKHFNSTALSSWKQRIEEAGHRLTVSENNGQLAAVAPLNIFGKDSGWRILIELPSSAVTNQLDALEAIFDEVNSESTLVGIGLSIVVGGLGILLMFWMVAMLLRPVGQLVHMLKDIAEGEGDLTRRIQIKSQDELGELAHWFNQFLDNLHRLISQVASTTEHIESAAGSSARVAGESLKQLQNQREQISMAAAAVHEMSASSGEVANSAGNAADATNRTLQATEDSQKVVNNAVDSIVSLSGEVARGTEVIRELEGHSNKISEILVTIGGVADQTNLLALNAAIEAARAGDHGRGFAVVADEVRGLAQSTQDATAEIQAMIENLQKGTSTAVSVMDSSRTQAEISVEQINQSNTALNEIGGQVVVISDMNTQIAASAEQQSSVSEDINRNVVAMDAAATEVAEQAQQNASAAEQLRQLAMELKGLVGRFRL